jgi:hypothetical protein
MKDRMNVGKVIPPLGLRQSIIPPMRIMHCHAS